MTAGSTDVFETCELAFTVKTAKKYLGTDVPPVSCWCLIIFEDLALNYYSGGKQKHIR